MSVSVVIPSRDPRYLQKTIDDTLAKASGKVEVIVVLDGYWTKLEDNKNVKIIHHGLVNDNFGMRESINKGMAIAQGDYVMKLDEHCMWDEGWDDKLKECEDNWVVIPRRKRLDPDKWENIEDGRNHVDYMYLTNPFMRPGDKSNGLRGAEWREKYNERKDVEIDDLMTTQGSCYFMPHKWWDILFPSGMDDEFYGPFTSEAQEICNTSWFMGGKVMVNKKTWYSHWWKGKRGKGYGFSRKQYEEHGKLTEKGRINAIKHWLTTKDYKRDFNWLMEKFSPVPTWPSDWKEYIVKKMKEYEKNNWYQ